MDDKRTLLAFLVVAIIFLLMPHYYEWLNGPMPEPVQEQVESMPAEREKSASEPAPLAERTTELGLAPPGAPGPATILPEPMTETFVDITTPRQTLRLSSVGGALVSATLLRYADGVGDPVELVPDGARGLLVEMRAETGGGDLDLSQVSFVPDRESLRLGEGDEGSVTLRADLGQGRFVEKILRVSADSYGAELTLRCAGFDDRIVAFLHWRGGIALAERDREVDLQAMKVMTYLNESTEDLQLDGEESERFEERGDVSWAAIRNKYFLVALSPLEGGRYRVNLEGRPANRPPQSEYDFAIGKRMERGVQNWPLALYIGPLDIEELDVYGRDLEQAMDLGWSVIRPIAKVLLKVLTAAHQVIPNYGWVIVLFGVVVKALVYPLTRKTYESTAKMQALQPKVAVLKEKYKNDKQRLGQAQMQLYRDEGVNPLSSCLPLLLQMPIFFALYQVFSSTIELRQAPFILWIDDLSVPDEILIGGFGLHVLPLLMSIAMYFQSKMTMKDPNQVALVYVMPVVMVFIMWNFSSGLVLYWTVFNVLQVAQQIVTNRGTIAEPTPKV
ncbi:MAG: membrane protein insertase YidC [Candidatus Latescibacterota bacterium]|nr:membrane protein insertase YidC [Candidatus Latescibacterota bacterium]